MNEISFLSSDSIIRDMAISPTKSRYVPLNGSPSRVPSSALASLSFNSPLSLRETIHKSGAPKKAIHSSSAASIAALGGGGTKKRNGSPIRLPPKDDSMIYSENRSPGKNGKGSVSMGGGGLGRMDIVGNDRDVRIESKKSPVKKGKQVRSLIISILFICFLSVDIEN